MWNWVKMGVGLSLVTLCSAAVAVLDHDTLCFDLQEPLNSADDVSEEDPTELFDSENVIVCQYDKVSIHKFVTAAV